MSRTVDLALAKSLIVIPSINGGKLLARALPTFRVPSEALLVLDQGSTDNTHLVCKQHGISILQLGVAHTYTAACNVGASIARDRGCEFLFVSNNDIVFRTDVVRELLEAMLADERLAIAAPSQLLLTREDYVKSVYRVEWDLRELAFIQVDTPIVGNPERIESDFCEMTFAVIRMSAIDEVGFLDEAYGFYHEDADFGYRLRQNGYSCAYLPRSQIEHYAGSTFGDDQAGTRRAYLNRSKALFQRKFLGYGVDYANQKSAASDSWSVVNRNLYPYLSRLALIDEARPPLAFHHPGTVATGYLYTVWETSQLPSTWLAFAHSYQGVFTPSRWGVDVLKASGFDTVSLAPLGVETDIFQPWGPHQRLYDEFTFLWLANNQHRKGLDVCLEAWRRFRDTGRSARLVLMGSGVERAFKNHPVRRYHHGNFRISEYDDLELSVWEIVVPLEDAQVSTTLRSVDAVLNTSRSEGFGLVIAESLACGVTTIFGDYGATADFNFEESLSFSGYPVAADYLDKGFNDVGYWWQPNIDDLVAKLVLARDLDARSRKILQRRGINLIRSGFTWRSTAFAIRAGLVATQQNYPPGYGAALERGMRRDLASRATSRLLPRSLRRVGNALVHTSNVWDQIGGGGALGQLTRRLVGRAAAQSQRLGTHLTAPAIAQELARRLLPQREGALYVGYAEEDICFGQSFRNLMSALAASKVPTPVFPIMARKGTPSVPSSLSSLHDVWNTYAINVIEIPTDQIPTVFTELRDRAQSHNILRTCWELPDAPDEWKTLLEPINEIWVPNKYVMRTFSRIFDRPIVEVPPHVGVDGLDLAASRAEFGLDPQRFYFLHAFDNRSSLHQTNPLGVAKAFVDAFKARDEDVGLVLHAIDTDEYRSLKSAVEGTVGSDDRIIQVNKALSRAKTLALVNACDCYVSLHRAVGFGLKMAEAMALGKAVIGTDFSGSTAFLSDETGFPVRYTLRPVSSSEHYWSRGVMWAEPNHTHAVDVMRRLVKDAALRTARARRGQAYVRANYGKHAAAAAVLARLGEVKATLANKSKLR